MGNIAIYYMLYFLNQKICNLSKQNSLYSDKIPKFPERDFFWDHFPCFPCAVLLNKVNCHCTCHCPLLLWGVGGGGGMGYTLGGLLYYT